MKAAKEQVGMAVARVTVAAVWGTAGAEVVRPELVGMGAAVLVVAMEVAMVQATWAMLCTVSSNEAHHSPHSLCLKGIGSTWSQRHRRHICRLRRTALGSRKHCCNSNLVGRGEAVGVLVGEAVVGPGTEVAWTVATSAVAVSATEIQETAG